MVGKQVREVRCEDVLAAFCQNNKGCCFLTLTTPDVVDIFEIRRRWRAFRHYLVELIGIKKGGGFKLQFVMNYEMHPGGHGWHIHAVFNCFVNLRGGFVTKIRSYGFGSIKVEKVTTKGVGDYLAKHALKAYRGVRGQCRVNGSRLRLVNCSRGLPRLSDYQYRDAFTDKVRKTCSRVRRVFPRLYFPVAWRMAEIITLECWGLDKEFGSYWGNLVDSRLRQMLEQGLKLGSRGG